MRRTVTALACLTFCAGTLGFACGDKFLVVGRGARKVPKAMHPARIVVYANPASALPLALKEARLGQLLKLAGHTPEVVADINELERALARRSVDLILAGPSDVATLRSHSTPAGAAPLLPLLYKPSAEQLKLLVGQPYVLVERGREKQVVNAIDSVLAGRRRSAD